MKPSKTIRFMKVSSLGIWSPIYSETYIIDRTAPKLVSTSPKPKLLKSQEHLLL
ncbi:hypothetical protein [Methanobacterium alcaliphilum]|uniref:hypothetical protein n=1 Tax=Methanobacterium alcaliphilum TaxID=392018 RepID=UPI003CCBBFA7